MNKYMRLCLLAVISVVAVALNFYGIVPVKATQVFINTLLIGFGLILFADLLIKTQLRERS